MDLLVPENMLGPGMEFLVSSILGPGMDWDRADILECHIHRYME
jgi:hypothetical protein